MLQCRRQAVPHITGYHLDESSWHGSITLFCFTTAVQLYLTWLGYFYLAMSLRENVLMVNGSHIKGWWVQHHYWSSACALLMLGLPVYSPGKSRGVGRED